MRAQAALMIAVMFVGGLAAGCDSENGTIENYAAMVCGCKTEECMDDAMGRFSKFRVDHPQLDPNKLEKLVEQVDKCAKDLDTKMHPRPVLTW